MVDLVTLENSSQDLDDLDGNVLIEKESHLWLRGVSGSVPVNVGGERFGVERASRVD